MSGARLFIQAQVAANQGQTGCCLFQFSSCSTSAPRARAAGVTPEPFHSFYPTHRRRPEGGAPGRGRRGQRSGGWRPHTNNSHRPTAGQERLVCGGAAEGGGDSCHALGRGLRVYRARPVPCYHIRIRRQRNTEVFPREQVSEAATGTGQAVAMGTAVGQNA